VERAVRALQFLGIPASRLLAMATLVLVSATAPLECVAAGESGPQLVRIPLSGRAAMVAGVYQPSGEGPHPVVVYSHGRSGPEERAETTVPDPRGFVRYWLRKGFAVVAPIRPGYGATGGPDREDSGVRYDIFGNCWGRPQFGEAAAAARDAVTSAIAWTRTQPWADAHRIVLVGTSMGGLASIATGARNPEGVTAVISFAGGTGGNGVASPEHTCGSEDMEVLMSRYGATTHVPSLWLYAQNDSCWGPERPRAWYRAFASGGSESRFVMTEGLRNADGHQLLGRGSRLWIAHVDRFLTDIGL
jgi:dienelactone hydrolase